MTRLRDFFHFYFAFLYSIAMGFFCVAFSVAFLFCSFVFVVRVCVCGAVCFAAVG